jgi:hypothetical protein
VTDDVVLELYTKSRKVQQKSVTSASNFLKTLAGKSSGVWRRYRRTSQPNAQLEGATGSQQSRTSALATTQHRTQGYRQVAAEYNVFDETTALAKANAKRHR